MSNICYFYATKDDLIAVTGQLESTTPIKYVRFGQVTKLPPESFRTAAQIPNLGIASHPSAVGCDKFLVCAPETSIRPERLKILTLEDVDRSVMTDKESLRELVGVERHTINQRLNPDTICFTPGGLWKNHILLHGGIDTASQSELSQTLMKNFQAAIKESFVKIKAFNVGPQALSLLKGGTRLTISAESPREFDLALPIALS